MVLQLSQNVSGVGGRFALPAQPALAHPCARAKRARQPEKENPALAGFSCPVRRNYDFAVASDAAARRDSVRWREHTFGMRSSRAKSQRRRCERSRRNYIMPPMPPIPPPIPPISGIAGAASFGASAIIASVVISKPATEAAF